MMKKEIMIIAGPTAVGKTGLSLELAKRLRGEVISADSMQIYKGMDIGTAKIPPEEREGIAHHLLDCLSPLEECNIIRFSHLARGAIESIHKRGRLPILTGGTGFYIQAVLYDIAFAREEGSGIRRTLEEEAQREGPQKMHERLALLDPASALAIHPNNKKRVIRAIEYALLNRERISEHNASLRQKTSPYRFKYVVLTMDRKRLYERINQRVEDMLRTGLVEEVKALCALGCREGMTSMQGIGYRQVLGFLQGQYDKAEMEEKIKRATRQFAKRQLTLFKRERDAV